MQSCFHWWKVTLVLELNNSEVIYFSSSIFFAALCVLTVQIYCFINVLFKQLLAIIQHLINK